MKDVMKKFVKLAAIYECPVVKVEGSDGNGERTLVLGLFVDTPEGRVSATNLAKGSGGYGSDARLVFEMANVIVPLELEATSQELIVKDCPLEWLAAKVIEKTSPLWTPDTDEIRQHALAKLTVDERAVLGLPDR